MCYSFVSIVSNTFALQMCEVITALYFVHDEYGVNVNTCR